MTESKDFSHGFHIFMDGNMWCAVGPHFRNVQEDRAGFGETPQAAYEAWWKNNEHGYNFRAVVHSKPDFSKFTLTHPEAQGNKDLGEPPLTRLEEKEGDIVRYDPAYLRRNGWKYEAATGYWFDRWHAVACRGWHTAQLEQRRRDLLQAALAAAPTSPQPIKGESELESASNGMGLR